MRKTGLIGRSLSHSQSQKLHKKFYELAGLVGEYSNFETSKNMLGDLIDKLSSTRYEGVNVTIPYKTKVIKHLTMVQDEALEIGAVNTIEFDCGRKIGHNTDFFGLKTLLETSGLSVEDKRVAILGTGGAAKCAYVLAKKEGASEAVTVSRTPSSVDSKINPISYDQLEAMDHIDILINATPIGMNPNENECPVPSSVIGKCSAVVDIIYNPEKTLLVKKAQEMGIRAVGGLMMLIAQAVKAQEIWTHRKFDMQLIYDLYNYMSSETFGQKPNIVLIGMMGCGKTTIGKRLAGMLKMEYFDTDEVIEGYHGSIPAIFEQQGESAFRRYETEIVEQVSTKKGAIISTGGGVILNERNMNLLNSSGTIIFIDRPLKNLLSDIDTTGRPLLTDGKRNLISLYTQRISLYKKYANIISQNIYDIDSCIVDIMKQWKEKME